MLKMNSGHLYVYVVDRDFGFAPNPFHGYCTLATCKPGIRGRAQVGDWIMGVGGSRLNATGRCVFLMAVSETLTFEAYWHDERFCVKRPYRNGSLMMMVGDNIYHRDPGDGHWVQEDSHHSCQDGSPNLENVEVDTSQDRVLISNHFYYFGEEAPAIVLQDIGYHNGRNYRKMPLKDDAVRSFIESMEEKYGRERNRVLADPFDFWRAMKRVNQSTGKIS